MTDKKTYEVVDRSHTVTLRGYELTESMKVFGIIGMMEGPHHWYVWTEHGEAVIPPEMALWLIQN